MAVFKTFFCLFILCWLPATFAATSTPISINFQASEFNHLSSTYMQRPTFAELSPSKKGKPSLSIYVDRYGARRTGFTLSQQYCDDYIALIDKYLDWEAIAARDGDIIDKPIGKAKNSNFGLVFSIFSGNARQHFLTIGYSSDYAEFFDRQNAIALKELILKLKNGELTPLDTESKYK